MVRKLQAMIEGLRALPQASKEIATQYQTLKEWQEMIAISINTKKLIGILDQIIL